MWTLFNCIKPPYEGIQRLPKSAFSNEPVKYVTVPAGRWFVWELPELIVESGKQNVKIAKIDVVALLAVYIGGVSAIGIAWFGMLFIKR